MPQIILSNNLKALCINLILRAIKHPKHISIIELQNKMTIIYSNPDVSKYAATIYNQLILDQMR